MNIRVEYPNEHAFPAGPAGSSFRNPAGLPRPDRASVVAVSKEVSAIVFDEPVPASGVTPVRRLTARISGIPVEKPFLTTRLARAGGGMRHVLLVKFSDEALARRSITLDLDGTPVAEVDPSWLQSAIADLPALIGGLTDTANRRLLHLLMTTGASLFGLSLDSGYGPVTRQLMALLGQRHLPLSSICQFGSAGHLLTYRLGVDEPAPDLRALLLERPDRTVHLKGFEAFVEETDANRLLHVAIPVQMPAGAQLVAASDRAWLLDGPDRGAEVQPLVPWLERRAAGTQAWMRSLLDAGMQADPVCGALLREATATEGHAPQLDIRHLSATRHGLLHAFSLTDPLDLARAIRIECGGEAREVQPDARPLVGYLPWPAGTTGPCRVQIAYHSGRLQTCFHSVPERFEGGVPEALGQCDPDAAARALARARLDGVAQASRGRVHVERFGARPCPVRLSIVVPASANPDIIRAQAASIFSQKADDQVELVTYMADNPEAATTRRRLADIHAVFGLAVTQVTLGGIWTQADALRAAIAQTEGDVTLLLGADVLPEGPDWLAGWLGAFRKNGPHVLGGVLLSSHGAILDAGAGPDLRPRFAGLPAASLPARSSAETCLVSTGCVALGADAKACLLSSPAVHPNPDILLADTICRVRTSGGRIRTSFRNVCVRYGAPADSDPLSLAADRISAAEIVSAAPATGRV